MSLDENTLRFLGRVYESAPDPDAFRGVLRETMSLLGSNFAMTVGIDHDRGSFEVVDFLPATESSAIDDGRREFLEGMHQYDPTLAAFARDPHASIIRSRDCAPVGGVDYDRWNRAHFGTREWTIRLAPLSGSQTFAMSLHRAVDADPLSADDDRLYGLIFDHLTRAVRFAARPIVDPDCASIFLDRHGRVLAMTDPARAALEHQPALSVDSEGQLHAMTAEGEKALRQALAALLRDGGVPTERHLRLSSANKVVWVSCRLTPLSAMARPFPLMHFAVRIDLDARVGATSLAHFMATAGHFDLTCREAELAALLLQAHSLESAAVALGISYNTARAHLRALFGKTETNRQSELLLCLSGNGFPPA